MFCFVLFFYPEEDDCHCTGMQSVKDNFLKKSFSAIYINIDPSEQNVLHEHRKHMPVVNSRPWAPDGRVQTLKIAPQKQKLHPEKQRRDPSALGPRSTHFWAFLKTAQWHSDVSDPAHFLTFNTVAEWGGSQKAPFSGPVMSVHKLRAFFQETMLKSSKNGQLIL